MSSPFIVVADDLTGAMDTGHSIAKKGMKTDIHISDDLDPSDAQVVVKQTDSRYISEDEAAERVRSAASERRANNVYKKIDSTLRGNLTAEIEAAASATNADVVVVAPAFPSNGRLTACGHHFVNGNLVTNTSAGDDPESPVEDAHLPSLLRGGNIAEVAHVNVNEINEDNVKSALSDGGQTVSFDAIHDRQLKTIAEVSWSLESSVLLVGSGGLAAQIPFSDIADPPYFSQARNHSSRCRTGNILGVVGSIAEETLSQLDSIPDHMIVKLNATEALHDGESAVSTAVDEFRDKVEHNETVIITSAKDVSDIKSVETAAKAAGISGADVRTRISRALSVAALGAWESAPAKGLFLTGGATANGVLNILESDKIALTGEEVSPGIPVGFILGGKADGAQVITKAGAFGTEKSMADALKLLSKSS